MKNIRLKQIRVPYCASCWDKGWSSVLSNQHTASDVEMGEHGGDKVFQKRNYCQCKKGRKLLRLENHE